jgi:hypothetical protein
VRIEEQIKALQRTKAKIDLYRKVQKNVEAELNLMGQDEEHKKLELEHPGLLKEFCSEVSLFCEKRVEALDNPKPEAPKREQERQQESLLSLKPQPTPPVRVPVASEEEPGDPIRFLMKYKHLDNKKVEFETKDGLVTGTVRGLVTPFIKVQTDTGYVVDVEPSKLKVL